ncbi:unnamed protein product [Gulo gulo]|uniref:Large ribosomal subunit protein eL36 n=1 Tax=Gulo gulo TaxID=48420 RepID=A0A9X9LKB2_GULGU|nr:unnamed protein product [Gulo gulo]
MSQQKHSHHGRRLPKHTRYVQDMIQETCGFTPCERSAMMLLKVSKDKRALKVNKKCGDTRLCREDKR